MKKKDLTMLSRIFLIILVFFWMFVIYQFSADVAADSQSLSDAVVNQFYKIVYHFTGKRLDLVLSVANKALLGYFFRKMAHVFIFFILSIFTMLFLFTFKINMWLRMVITLLFCGGYALLDEYHQMFVEGRGSSLKDVLIDSSGAFLGILVSLIIFCIIYTIYHVHESKKMKKLEYK